MSTKPAIKSLGVLGTISSMGTMIGLISAVIAWWDSIPPELKDETIAFLTIHGVAFVQQLIGLIGRWRATVPIQGFFKTPK